MKIEIEVMEFYTTKHVAEKLGFSIKWVRILAEKGTFKSAFRLSSGGNWRFRKEEFEREIMKKGNPGTFVDYQSGKVSRVS